MRHLSRRGYLTNICSVSAPLVSGCAAIDASDDDDESSGCQVGYRHLDPEIEERSIVYADSSDPSLGFSLEVTPTVVEFGSDFTVTLTNVSDRDLETYADDRLAIQLDSAEEWHTIFGVADDHEWTDRTVVLSPGDDRSWELRSSIADAGLEPYSFCSIPTGGRYRVLFWGFPHEPESDPLALATEFTIVEGNEVDGADDSWSEQLTEVD